METKILYQMKINSGDTLPRNKTQPEHFQENTKNLSFGTPEARILLEAYMMGLHS